MGDCKYFSRWLRNKIDNKHKTGEWLSRKTGIPLKQINGWRWNRTTGPTDAEMEKILWALNAENERGAAFICTTFNDQSELTLARILTACGYEEIWLNEKDRGVVETVSTWDL